MTDTLERDARRLLVWIVALATAIQLVIQILVSSFEGDIQGVQNWTLAAFFIVAGASVAAWWVARPVGSEIRA